jgi:hypothetical protein
MPSKRFMETLKQMSEYLGEYREMNNDFLMLYDHLIVLYARNVFKHNSNWKKMERDFFVDYTYIRETECEKDLLKIQSETRKYAKIFKIFCSENASHQYFLISYRNFIKESMELLIKKVINPFSIRLDSCKQIIEKYSYMKKIKSKKINYEVLEQLGIKV